MVGSSMFVSLLSHHQIIEEKSKDTDDYRFVYFALFNIIQLTFFVTSVISKFYNNLFKIEFVNNAYYYFKKVNDFYVIGRNKILTTLSKVAFSAVVPFPPLGMVQPGLNTNFNNNVINNNGTVHNKKETVKVKTNVFKDTSDMNNFLDSLIKEKAN